MTIIQRANDEELPLEGTFIPSRVGPTSSVLHETSGRFLARSSQTVVSTNCILSGMTAKKQCEEDVPKWYALRTTYGREKKAYDYMTEKGVTAFYPTQTTVKLINGKRKVVTESRLPNIFFAYGTFNQIKSFVYDNVNLPFLRFYYRHTHRGNRIEKTPMTVPAYQMESLMVICEAESADTVVSLTEIPKFKEGQLVKVMEGAFKGVVGRVARWHGQQRVAVMVDGLVTVVTAYVPSAFLKHY